MRWIGVLGALLLSVGCFKTTTPVRTLALPGERSDTLVVLLPGFGASDETWVKKEVVRSMREAGLDADLVAVNAHYGYYVGGELMERLTEDVLTDAFRTYDHVWVMGISMGGLGTLLTVQEYGDRLDGVVLLSPFLGRGKTLKDVQSAALRDYAPPAEPMWDEELWGFLKRLDAEPDSLPPIYLGHGDRDLGVANHHWLATYLPPERVRVVPGGHTWKVWRELAGAFVAEDGVGTVAAGRPAVVAAP